MSVEENKIMHRRFTLESLNHGNLAVADELAAADLVDHNAPPGLAPGLAGFKQFVTRLRAGFPDVAFTIEDEIAEGDKVVVRTTMRGTHTGEFLGIPPTGRKVTMGTVDIVRIANGKIVEHWGQQDTLGMLQQLGVIPMPEAPAR